MREPLRRTFDTAAELYEAARPSYPEELFDDLAALWRLRRPFARRFRRRAEQRASRH